MNLRFGRLPAHPEQTHPRLHLRDHLTAQLPAPPAQADWHTAVASWPMYLNDQIGDCTEAMVGHCIENASTYGQGTTIEVADSDVLTAYERVSGYDPNKPDSDQGAVLQDVYGDWVKHGVGGHKATVFAQVDHANATELKQAVDLLGAVGLGITVTQDMMDAFNAGQPWSTATGEQLGGHAVPIVGYDADFVYVVTWAKVQKMTWACYAVVTEEAWAAVLPEWFSAAGLDPTGLDLYGLGEEFAGLTGGQNPFPAPTPTPTPGPAPVSADETLAEAATPWLGHRHTGDNKVMAEAIEAWISAKGL